WGIGSAGDRAGGAAAPHDVCPRLRRRGARGEGVAPDRRGDPPRTHTRAIPSRRADRPGAPHPSPARAAPPRQAPTGRWLTPPARRLSSTLVRRMERMIRQFASLLLAVTLIATFSTRAFAHARYQGSNPADGETV